MNQFNLNKFSGNTSFNANSNKSNSNQPQQKPELQLEELVSTYIKENSANNNTSSTKSLPGNFINNSDTELIKSHLEQYLHTDSLRLEIQIDRLSEELETTQRQLKGLNLLPNSELKLNQQKALLTKRSNILQALNYHKEEYRQISPIHKFALWLKDKMKTTNGIGDKVKRFLYGKQATLIDELKQANSSMRLLVDQLQTVNQLPDSKESSLNIVDVVQQYEEIESNIETIKQNYFNNQPTDYLKEMKKRFQRMYYGYEIPEERYANAYRAKSYTQN